MARLFIVKNRSNKEYMTDTLSKSKSEAEWHLHEVYNNKNFHVVEVQITESRND